LLVQLGWSGTLGIILAFLLPKFSSKGFLGKGMIYTFMVAFIFRGIVVLFQVPFLDKVSYTTSFLNFASGLVWGLVTVYTLYWLDKKLQKN
jgi:hypothetical protein